MAKKTLIGKIISDKMQKTVVVEVERIKEHPKYKRRYKIHKKYKAHSEGEFGVGDKVMIEECRPISKDKKWKVVKKI
jgi:small subunit ribosomal protein S17